MYKNQKCSPAREYENVAILLKQTIIVCMFKIEAMFQWAL